MSIDDTRAIRLLDQGTIERSLPLVDHVSSNNVNPCVPVHVSTLVPESHELFSIPETYAVVDEKKTHFGVCSEEIETQRNSESLKPSLHKKPVMRIDAQDLDLSSVTHKIDNNTEIQTPSKFSERYDDENCGIPHCPRCGLITRLKSITSPTSSFSLKEEYYQSPDTYNDTGNNESTTISSAVTQNNDGAELNSSTKMDHALVQKSMIQFTPKTIAAIKNQPICISKLHKQRFEELIGSTNKTNETDSTITFMNE